MSGIQYAIVRNTNGFVVFLNIDAHVKKLGGNRFQVLGNDVVYVKITLRCRSSNHKGSRFDHVGNDGIFTTVQFFHTVDLDNRRTCATDICAASIQKVGNINHMRLSCGIFNDGSSLRKHSRKNRVDRCTDGHATVKIDILTAKSAFGIGRGINATVIHVNDSTQFFKRFDVQVDRSCTQIATAR